MSTPKNIGARRIAVLAGSVAGLAMLILIFAALQTRGPAEPQSREQSRLLATQAADALRSGDETLALALAERALLLDTRNSAAAGVTERVAARRSARKPDGGTGGAREPSRAEPVSAAPEPAEPTKAGDPGFDEPIKDLAVLLPASFEGYSVGTAVALEGEASLSASASGKTGPNKIVWAVHDTGSRRGAQDFISDTSKKLYGSDARDVRIDEVDAYFGTDGTRFATVVYSRGRHVFEVLVSGTDDAPAGYRDVAMAASKAFGDTLDR